MPTATSLRWALAAIMIAISIYHAGRLGVAHLRHRRTELDVGLTHTAMGIAMTIMLVGQQSPEASHRWAVVFAVPLLWFAWRGLRTYVLDGPGSVGTIVGQAIGCAAMLYMLLATAGLASAPMAGMAMPSVPTSPLPARAVAALLVVALGGVALSTAVALARERHVRGAGARTPSATLAPATTACCQLAMNVIAAYLLAVML